MVRREEVAMSLSETLDRVSDIIKEGWCQGMEAADKDGIGVYAIQSEACAWCLTGAVVRALPLPRDESGGLVGHGFQAALEQQFEAFAVLADAIAEVRGKDCFRRYLAMDVCRAWNDVTGRTKEEVLELVAMARRKVA